MARSILFASQLRAAWPEDDLRSFRQIVVFGDSLSDPGNAFALTGQHLTPPTSGMTTPEDLLTLIPDAPMRKGAATISATGPTCN